MLNCVGNDTCTCPCHLHPDQVKHIMPCCQPCPNCGRNISVSWYAVHKDHCQPLMKNPAPSTWKPGEPWPEAGRK